MVSLFAMFVSVEYSQKLPAEAGSSLLPMATPKPTLIEVTIVSMMFTNISPLSCESRQVNGGVPPVRSQALLLKSFSDFGRPADFDY